MTEELVSVPVSKGSRHGPADLGGCASEKQFDTVVPGEDLVDGFNNRCGREVIAVDQTDPSVGPQCFSNSVPSPVNAFSLVECTQTYHSHSRFFCMSSGSLNIRLDF
mmetsp:Transcript_868/g.2019  ORF Transcript_868/g.2019 Transcript_868/m.2019 type:complete len:107 (-) Transcript_868:298-618(-)